MIEVELPDGRIIEFPDGTSAAEMSRVVSGIVGQPSAPQSNVESFARGFKDGATIGLGDEYDAAITGGLWGGKDTGQGIDMFEYGTPAAERMESVLGGQRSLIEESQNANPVMHGAGVLAGSLAGPTRGGGAFVAAGRGLLPRIGRAGLLGGAQGAAYGGASGAGETRADKALMGGLLGAGFGGAVPVAGRLASNVIGRFRDKRALSQAAANAPTADQLRTQAGAIFDNIKNQPIPTGQLPSLANNIDDIGRNMGMDDMLTPGASRVAQNARTLAQTQQPGVPLQDLNILRQQAAIPAGNLANRQESSIGTQMIQQIDDFVDSVTPQLGAQGKEARAMWGTLRRSELVESAIERARTAASGFENGLQIEFRRILRSPKLLRGFSDAEVKAMNSVVNGGVLHGLLRQVGRIGFSLDGGSNALGGAMGAALGGAMGATAGGLAGGIPGAIAATAIGTGARKLSETVRSSAANRAASIVRTPGAVQLPARVDPVSGILGEILMRSSRAGAMLAN